MLRVTLCSFAARLLPVLGLALLVVASPVRADEPSEATETKADETVAAEAADDKSSSSAAEKKPTPKKPKYPTVAKVLEDTKEIDGVIKLHLSDTKLFAELKSSDLNKDFFVLITIAKGIGQTPLLGGFSWNDNWVWQFRKQGENLQIVRRNVRFKAKTGTPTAEAVKLAYTDSILFSLPIKTRGSGGSYIVDLTSVFFTDLPQVSQVLRGFSFSKQRSSWGDVKGYTNNVEIQVAATYASGGTRDYDTIPDSRAATINLHYSISKLPKTDYKPRVADDRIGYFLTAVKDFSKEDPDTRFVRYINRWNLQKEDSKADISMPKKPIKFWLEKTVPFEYRKPIRDGIEEWNKGFEKAGFYNAIEVEQQAKSADWDPGDINYNTFRWITSGAGFAMGPSRVNPTTGEILDADIIFDADFLQYWRNEYEYFTPQGIEALTGGPVEIEGYRAQQAALPARLRGHQHNGRCSCNLLGGASQQLAYAATVAAVQKRKGSDLDKLIMQGLKEVTMHEVGHTLGLRHNFKASTLYSIEEMQDVEKMRETGMVASVMDYAPVFLLPKRLEQTDYYTTTIGAYDYWAIEYGYKPLKDEKKGLAEIAARSGEPELAYATDEDTRGIDPDPHSRRFDFSNDLVEYAELQAELVAETLPTIVEDLIEEGEGYQKARQAFGVLLNTHGSAMFNASRYIGGVYRSRSHKGDADAPAPMQVVEAEKQLAALELLEEQVFSDKPFDIPAELYNQLAPSMWRHWGTRTVDRPDYPVQEVILLWQQRILDRVFASLTLRRVLDNEFKVSDDEEMLTVADLFERTTAAITSEISDFEPGEYTNRKPAISPLRRNLQRAYIERLSMIALGRYYFSVFDRRGRDVIVDAAPQDCQTLAFLELRDLKKKLDLILEDDPELDRYTEAHLVETASRIEKVLDADTLSFPLKYQYLDKAL